MTDTLHTEEECRGYMESIRYAIYLFIYHKKGISSVQLTRDISVTQKTVWFMFSLAKSSVAIKVCYKAYSKQFCDMCLVVSKIFA